MWWTLECFAVCVARSSAWWDFRRTLETTVTPALHGDCQELPELFLPKDGPTFHAFFPSLATIFFEAPGP